MAFWLSRRFARRGSACPCSAAASQPACPDPQSHTRSSHRAPSTVSPAAALSRSDDDGRIASPPRPRSFASCCSPLRRHTHGREPGGGRPCRSCGASRGLGRLAEHLFAEDGLHAGDLPSRLLDFGRIFNPAGHKLKPEVEQFLLQVLDLLLQLHGRQATQVLHVDRVRLHGYRAFRATNMVAMGSLCAAKRRASWATSGVTPSISYRMRPGFTTATQYSGLPLPFPMRVSAGFLVIGLSGKTRTPTRPPRFTCRVMAIRAASSCRFVIQPGSSALRPYSPSVTRQPREALPRRRPLCMFPWFP